MKRFVVVSLVVLLVAFSALAASAQVGKIGFGFDPGLVEGKDYVPGQLIVGLSNGIHINSAQLAGKVGGKVLKEIRGEAILLQFSEGADVAAAARALARLSAVGFVERNGIYRIPPVIEHGPAKKAEPDLGIMSVSGDAGTAYQWHHTVIRGTAAFTPPATVPAVAVIDTGVDYNHPDLSAAGKVIKGKNCVGNNTDPYDDQGHGTHVAGIIAATGGNGQYGEGVCPDCKIYAVKVLGADGSGSSFDIAECMKDVIAKKATHNIKVANMSLGGGQSTLISNQVLAMKNAEIALAAAAGNSNTTDTTSAWPGADPNVSFRVMASEQNDCRASFSNYSPSGTPSQFNITAPGYEILSTYPDAQYKTLSGTSMATPVVAGVAAMVWGKFPANTRAGLVTRILNNGKLTGCGFAANTKRVNLRAAITGTGETAIVGRLLDPFTGKPTSPQSTATTAQLKSGATVLASDATTKGGFYEITGLAAGTARTLKGVKTGAVNDVFLRSGIAITAGAVVGPFTDAFPASRATGNAAVTLDWRNLQPQIPEVSCLTGCKLGWEMDLIVKLPDGSYILPYFINSTMWQGELLGAPFVKSPRDSYNDSEPLETVVIGSSAANGTYQVIVLNGGDGTTNWGFNPQWTNSGASVQIYNGAAPLTGGSHQTVPAGCGSSFFWHVGNMVKTGTSYVWTAVKTCTDTLP